MTLVWVAALGAVAGAIAGSFLATLILRWPEGRTVAAGRSACDGCGRTLNAKELVPIFSALFQHGRCRTCQASIDRMHMRVELACAAIGGAAFALAPISAAPGWSVLGWLLLTLAILDARHFWLPDALTLPLGFLGLMLGWWTTFVALPDRLIGAVVGWLSLFLLAHGYRLLRGREGLGLGDAKLLGALGAWFGWAALPFILLSASGIALLAVLIARGWAKADARIPLGSFLCIGAIPGWMLSARLLGL